MFMLLDFRVEIIFTSAPDASKNIAYSKSDQKWLYNNHLAFPDTFSNFTTKILICLLQEKKVNIKVILSLKWNRINPAGNHQIELERCACVCV